MVVFTLIDSDGIHIGLSIIGYCGKQSRQLALHAGPATARSCTFGKKNRLFFYPKELKLCTVIESFMLNYLMVLFFDFNGFWRRNDVTVLKANFHFSLMAPKLYDSERTR